ncbi:MAG: polyhydroxyalkanoic acid system family protein [Verrucomicrobiota bacterium]
MPKFELDIPHTLPEAEVRTRLGAATGKIEANYGATCAWTNDRLLTVSRKGFDAQVAIESARVHVEMNLGFLLVPLAGAIKTGLTKELTALLTKPAQAATDGSAT